MQMSFGQRLLPLLKKILLLIGLYALSRLVFWLIYRDHFTEIAFFELIRLFVVSVRFDLSVIMLLNALFVLLYLLPGTFSENRKVKVLAKALFILINAIAFLANCVDLAYFEFTLKRTTADVFHFFGGEIGNDAGRLIPLFLKDYWYIVLFWLALVVLLIKGYDLTEKTSLKHYKQTKKIHYVLYYILAVAITIVLYRGGLQLKPITLVDAGEYTNSRNIPLVLNTPFTIIKTLDIENITPVVYFSDEKDLKRLFNPVKTPANGIMDKQNVFVIILESFSKEYVGKLNNRSYGFTPFLDSIMDYSLVCTNAFSNGRKSIEGIPAITASIPTWMGEAYITSAYGGNTIKGLAQLLADEGYYTAFFHGGENGTMGFESFAHVAGYKDYFGKNEYPDKRDDDGSWGIWDEEFLQFTAETISRKKAPFFTTVFTLSSHHPFAVPPKYSTKFKGGFYPIHKTIEYTDFALSRFFETAKKMPWYNNTLFVFCADHTSISSDPFYINKVGTNAIPIIYFKPDGSLKKKENHLTQQIDIMPSILDYLKYNKPYFAFGNSVFDSVPDYFMTYYSGWFDYMEGDYILSFDGQKSSELYNYTNDSLLTNNIVTLDTLVKNNMEKRLKAIIQTYQQSLINNKMTAENK